MIAIRSLHFRYPQDGFQLAIDDLAIEAGETVGIIGPSGAGKSTFLNLIAGLLKPATGTISVDGQQINALSDAAARRYRASRLGFVFQDFGLLDYLSAHGNILYPYRVSSALELTAEIRERFSDLTEKAGISGLLKRRPAALSQGEKQRVAICRALLHKPKLILADEATGNLDPDNKTIVLDLIQKVAAESGATLVAVTHDHDLLPRFQRVIDFRDFGGRP